MRSRDQEKETVAAVFSGTYSDTIFAPDYAIFIYCLIVLHDFPGNLEACSRFVQHCNSIVCVTLSIIKSETRNLHMHLKFANFISSSDQQKVSCFEFLRNLIGNWNGWAKCSANTFISEKKHASKLNRWWKWLIESLFVDQCYLSWFWLLSKLKL